ncbi:phosphoribosylamine--glycine ligase [Leptospira inadai serovar Lyme str. 10]|uniref:Phosphoribosylamine--glycine ligase n=2 Tax=Leptospira inadai serovar Lyme TaxID=293084 RepID=V6HYN7_9LEPT|nr:hypothetical protein [Leptospira inadai]EQA38129.1 phosphoribosylamine--glycine ligase [Leptospira inadai serovar Lyme str. 10]PNV75131.1 phosphoribosylamine--glycine ligase [Leptospira inadai serovar Lyme]
MNRKPKSDSPWLIYGSGNAREHITYERLSSELGTRVGFLLYGPNALLAELPGVISIRGILDAERVAKKKNASVIFLLSPGDLLNGAPDFFRERGFTVFAPKPEAIPLEGSKLFAKEFMRRHSIPTPRATVWNEFGSASEFLRTRWAVGNEGFVLKTDNFLINAAERVLVPKTLEEALTDLQGMFARSAEKRISSDVLLEEKIKGEEYSIHLAVANGKYAVFPLVQDYKKLKEGGTGPNTEGIGAVASTDPRFRTFLDEVEDLIVRPVMHGLISDGLEYNGILYIGIMDTAEGPQCLEFNVRSGNPEWLPLLHLMETPLSVLFEHLLAGKLFSPVWKSGSWAASVVAFPKNYPLGGEDERNDHSFRFARLPRSIKLTGERIRKSGDFYRAEDGRCFTLTSIGSDCKAMMGELYAYLEAIESGLCYRSDVGKEGISFRKERAFLKILPSNV